eukprot:7516645-Ditylum_brightwellii.AAC.1
MRGELGGQQGRFGVEMGQVRERRRIRGAPWRWCLGAWVWGDRVDDLGGLWCASGEGFLGLFGLGGGGCLWSELVLIFCVKDVRRQYFLWRVRGLDRRSGEALSSIVGDWEVGDGTSEQCQVGWLSMVMCLSQMEGILCGLLAVNGIFAEVSVETLRPHELAVLGARAEPFSCPDWSTAA